MPSGNAPTKRLPPPRRTFLVLQLLALTILLGVVLFIVYRLLTSHPTGNEVTDGGASEVSPTEPPELARLREGVREYLMTSAALGRLSEELGTPLHAAVGVREFQVGAGTAWPALQHSLTRVTEGLQVRGQFAVRRDHFIYAATAPDEFQERPCVHPGHFESLDLPDPPSRADEPDVVHPFGEGRARCADWMVQKVALPGERSNASVLFAGRLSLLDFALGSTSQSTGFLVARIHHGGSSPERILANHPWYDSSLEGHMATLSGLSPGALGGHPDVWVSSFDVGEETIYLLARQRVTQPSRQVPPVRSASNVDEDVEDVAKMAGVVAALIVIGLFLYHYYPRNDPSKAQDMRDPHADGSPPPNTTDAPQDPPGNNREEGQTWATAMTRGALSAPPSDPLVQRVQPADVPVNHARENPDPAYTRELSALNEKLQLERREHAIERQRHEEEKRRYEDMIERLKETCRNLRNQLNMQLDRPDAAIRPGPPPTSPPPAEESVPRPVPVHPPTVLPTGLAARATETIGVAALGSRDRNKIPQDASVVARDALTGAVAYVVCDGASHTRAESDFVRWFALETARLFAKVGNEYAPRLIHRAQAGDAPSVIEPELRSFITARLSKAIPVIVARQPRYEEAACVVGGAFWVPESKHLALVTLGNISLLVCIQEAGVESVAAIKGDDNSMVHARPKVEVNPADVQVAVMRLEEPTFTLYAMTDGLKVSRNGGVLPRVDIRQLVGATEPLEEWARKSLTQTRLRGPDFFVRPDPGDDETILEVRHAFAEGDR